eukprot:GILK01003194.1.p1 GENE.GILK01003194.1~~GILK01003194.1.p1  ORF type:complete len:123 (-),score=16.70 GILK01003194.1:199-525(-)
MAAAKANKEKHTEVDIPPPVFHVVDMNEEMRQFAVHCAVKGIRSVHKGEKRYWKDVAEYVKRQFDEKYSPGTWHCIVGKHFGSYVTHEAKNLVYFHVGQVAFLMFKHG